MNRETRTRLRFFLAAHPLQALAETWILALLILFPFFRLAGRLPGSSLTNGVFMVCAICGTWVVLRTRVPESPPLGQVLEEVGIGVALSLVMGIGVRLTSDLLGWSVLWEQTTLGEGSIIVLLMTGPGYLVTRIGVRLLRYWDRIRRRRLLLSLTHAHLMVALVVMAVFVVGISVYVIISGDRWTGQPGSSALVVLIVDRIVRTLFPLLALSLVMMSVVGVVLLPLSAAASFFLARRTTRRLQRLADAAGAMRAGAYDARVEVEGQDEVAQLQADFNGMAEALERTMEELESERDTVSRLLASRRELLANVSHELRTPVATVRATLESLLDDEETLHDPALAHDLEVMEGEVLRLQRLIADLFTLSQAEVAQLSLERRPADVAPIVQRMVDAVAPLAWQTGRVEVVADLPDTLPPALVDPSRLEQVISNLLRNGIRYTPPGGIVAVMAAAEGDEAIRIEVRDTGAGIPPEELSRIWERFYRGERGQAEGYRGAGLGLALVEELTEAMGGTVAVESVMGEGSCFTLKLPQA
jgi:signal transduction histidine kinase